MSQVALAIGMLQLLSSGNRIKKQRLAELLETTPRNLISLRNELELAGYTINVRNGRDGGYYLEGGMNLPIALLSPEESAHLKALFAGWLTTQSRGVEMVAGTALGKLNQWLSGSADVPELFNAQRRKLLVDPVFYRQHIRMTEQAIVNKERMIVCYQSPGKKVKEYEIEPYECFLYEDVWYVYAKIRDGKFITLKMNRLKSVRFSGTQFTPLKTDDRRKSISSFGPVHEPVEVHVRIHKMNVMSEYQWGEHQIIDWIDEQTFELTCQFANRLSALSFLREVLPAVEIIAPEDLKQTLMQQVCTFLERNPSLLVAPS